MASGGQRGPSFNHVAPAQAAPARRLLPTETYKRFFANGRRCFRCALTGHNYRECPHVQEPTLASDPCTHCQQAHILAYHTPCQGRILRLHQNPSQAQHTFPRVEELTALFENDSDQTPNLPAFPESTGAHSVLDWPAKE